MKNRNFYSDSFLKNKNILLLLLNFSVVLLLFGTDCVLEYATDTYCTFWDSQFHHMLYDNGRIINAVVYYIIERLPLSNNAIYILSFSVSLIFLTLALYVLSKRIIKSTCIDPLMSVLTAALLVANIYIIEYFLFIETGLFMIAIYFTVKAFDQTVSYFESRKKAHLWIALGLLILTVFMYQIFLGFYVVLCLPYILKYSDNFKKFFLNNCIVIGMYTVVMGIALFVTRVVLGSHRTGVEDSFGEVFRRIVHSIGSSLRNSSYILPKYIFFIELTALLIVTVVVIGKTKKWIQLLKLIYLGTCVVLFAYAPYILKTTNDYSIRILYPYASILGVLLLNLFLNLDFNLNKAKRYDTVLVLMIICFLIQLFSFHSIFIDRYKNNQSDKIICEIILDRIEQYEQETGITISQIAFYDDKEKSRSYKDSKYSLLNVKASFTSWSDLNSIKTYTARPFKRGKQNEEIKTYFSECNWDTFREDQLIFDGDTLHLCLY